MTKLLNSLLKSGHQSVFEHVNITFAIDGVSRALTHQLVRHRIASYSQQSQRYVDLRKDHSGDGVLDALLSFVLPPSIKNHKRALEIYNKTLREIVSSYNKLRHLGISGEDARYLAPNASKSRIVMTINLRSLMNFFSLRLCNRAQWEIRNLAKKMLTECIEIIPELFENFGAKCEQLGFCPEDKGCGKLLSLKALLSKVDEDGCKRGRRFLKSWNIEVKSPENDIIISNDQEETREDVWQPQDYSRFE
jgi:thymidylate synthase (FAD)